MVENTSYSPFGAVLEGGSASRYDYTGQEYDSVLGDYDYNARMYNAEWGQFSQPDKLNSYPGQDNIKMRSVYNPQSINPYSYVLNNPYYYKDNNGLWAVIAQGGYGVGVGPTSGSTAINLGICYSADYGLQFGFFGSESWGTTYGLGVEYAVGASISPRAKSFDDLMGDSDTKGISAAFGHGGSIDVSTSSNDDSMKSYSFMYSPGLSLEFHSLSTDSSGSYFTLFYPQYSYFSYNTHSNSYERTSSSSASGGSGVNIQYDTFGRVKGGKIGDIGMSEGFANLFNKYFGKNSAKSKK